MRARLGESLRYVLSELEGQLDVPTGMDAFFARLAAGPVDVQAFGAYYDLVLAIEQQAAEAAEGHLREIAEAPARRPGLRVLALDDTARSERYGRFIDTDPDMRFALLPPAPDVVAANREAIDDALELLARGAPEIAEEIRALLQEIVIAAAPEGVAQNAFDGASCFMLWGGVVLNGEARDSTLEMVEALVHESAHNVLFGFSTDGSLVSNEDRDRFASPLRQDPRPMDGIFHATFVTARMHYATARLLASGALDAATRNEAGAALEGHRKAFEAGLVVVDEHGELTDTGTAVLAAARRYMAGASDSR